MEDLAFWLDIFPLNMPNITEGFGGRGCANLMPVPPFTDLDDVLMAGGKNGRVRVGVRASWGGGGVQPPCVTFRRVVVSLRGHGQSPVLPFACCVGSLRAVGRCGRCSCWCHFRVRGAQRLVCRGCAGCADAICALAVPNSWCHPPPPPAPLESANPRMDSECASGCTWSTARATARLRDGRPPE